MNDGANPKEAKLAIDLHRVISHNEDIDMDAHRVGPVTRNTVIARRHEHVELPEEHEDVSTDDPEDGYVCPEGLSINFDPQFGHCLCPNGCEYCRRKQVFH